jgi:mRNA interferase RelE/StbE
MGYTVLVHPAADRDLESISPPERRRIIRRIASLAVEPRPPGVKKLRAKPNRWSVRAGNYRVIYRIQDDARVVLVIRIKHRREAYR